MNKRLASVSIVALLLVSGCSSAARWLTPWEIKQSAAAVEAYLQYDLMPDLEGEAPLDKQKHQQLAEPAVGSMRAINDFFAGRKPR